MVVVMLVWPVKLKHGELITVLAFSPDSSVIASGSADHTVRLWDVATGKQILKIKGIWYPRQIEFIGNGETLVSGGWGDPVCFWDVTTGVRKFEIPHDSIDTFAISPKEDFIVASGNIKYADIKVWDLRMRKERYVVKSKDMQIYNLSISYDGKYFSTAGSDMTFRIFDIETGKEIYQHSLKKDSNISSCKAVFSTSNNIVALGVSGPNSFVYADEIGLINMGGDRPNLVLLDVANKKEILNIGGVIDLESFAFLPPNGEKLITFGIIVQIWDAKTSKEIFRFVPSMEGSNRIYALSPDGNILAVGDDEGYIKLWDIKTGKEIVPK